MAVALNPQGDTLAFDLLGRIWLMPVEGGESVPITDPYGNARQPSWSPDGTKLTFQAYWDGNWHIYTVNSDGSNLQKITSGDFDHREPHWSPDGSSLLFSSDRNGTYDIWSRHLITEKLTPITSGEGNEYGPAWSADGTSMVYMSEMKESEYALMSRNTATGQETTLYTTTSKLSGASWSPDTHSILFNQHEALEASLKRLEVKTQEVQTLSDEGEDVFPFRPAWSSDSTLIYTAAGNMYQLGLDETKQKIPFSVQVSLDRSSYIKKKREFDDVSPQVAKGIVSPSISPDGKSILFVALQDIWIQTEGKVKQLTDDPYVQIYPIWSPDGTKVAYCSDRDESFGIWLMDLTDQSTEMVAATGSSISGMAWSPNGDKIAFTQNFGPKYGTLNILDLATGTSKPMGKGLTSSLGAPTWSPNGEIVAISVLSPYSTMYREGVNRVMLFHINEGPVRAQKAPEHWSFGVRAGDGPAWSPDGKYMAVASKGSLWLLPVDELGNAAGDPIEVTDELSDAPSWSGDSQTLLYTTADQIKRLNISDRSKTLVPMELEWSRRHPEGTLLIHAGGLVDAASDTLRRNVDILIENNRITQILPHEESRKADRVVDASDAFVMPGLIDIHVHEGSYNGERLGRTWLSWGVTTVRIPAGDPYDALNRREAIQSGQALGARIYFTGSPIDGSRIFYDGGTTTTSERQVDQALAKAEALDYDLIKTYVRLPDLLQKRVVEGAHKIGIPVTSHELYPAVGFNIDGVEHVKGTSRRGFSAKLSETRQAYDDVTDLLAQSGMWFTPTTAIYLGYQYCMAREPSLMEDPRLQELGEFRYLSSISASVDQIKEDQETYDQLYQNVIRMVYDVHRKGGLVVAGTDSPIIPQGLGLHIELENYQDAGLSPIEVLRTATINNAKVLNAESDLGTIEPGKLADLIIVDENPLEDIRNARKTRTVIKNGEVYDLQLLIKGEGK